MVCIWRSISRCCCGESCMEVSSGSSCFLWAGLAGQTIAPARLSGEAPPDLAVDGGLRKFAAQEREDALFGKLGATSPRLGGMAEPVRRRDDIRHYQQGVVGAWRLDLE